MAYTGAWRSAQKTTPPADANPNLGNAVDRTQHTEADKYFDPYPEPTPQLPPTPAYLYAADDWLAWPEPLVHDPVLTEPLGHEYGEVQGGEHATQLGSIAEAYQAHMADYGGAAVHHANEAIERAERDTYVTQRLEMPFPSTGSRAALTRGRNAWPENNPEGPPDQGHYTMRWIDRQFTRRGIRTDQQPLRPYTAAGAMQVPAPGESNGSPYTSPYARIANARQLKLTTPQIRRVPRPPDDDAIVDGTSDPQYQDPSYWQDW
jgi:hypothetical protein